MLVILGFVSNLVGIFLYKSGNFFRIRSAFAFGAKRLARLLDCPKEDIYYEVNQFFMNTWDRHGSGRRPDAPKNDLWRLRLSSSNGSENCRQNSNPGGKGNDNSTSRETQVDRSLGLSSASSQHNNHHLESTTRTGYVSPDSQTQAQKNYSSTNNRIPDQIRRVNNSNQNANNDAGQKNLKPDHLANDMKGRYFFARTRSSPELTDTYGEVPFQGKNSRASESGKGQIASARLDNSRRKNLETDALPSPGLRSTIEDPSSARNTSSHESLDASADTNSVFSSYNDESVLSAAGEDFSSIGTHRMQQEQDLVNMMASSMAHGFHGQVPIPLNFASNHLPLPLPPSLLASMGYQRNLGGMVPTNVPLIDTPSGANMHFPSLVSSPLTHYFPGIGLTSNPDDALEHSNENFGHWEMNPGEGDHDYWNEQEQSSAGGFDLDNGSFEALQSDDKQQSTSGGYTYVPPLQTGGTGSSRRTPQRFPKETRGSMREDHADSLHYQETRGNEVHFDDRSVSSRSIPTSQSSSLRSKTNSESSWDGSSAKNSKSGREKRGRKTASTAASGKGNSVTEHASVQIDDNRDWNAPTTMTVEIPDRSSVSQSVTSLHVPRHQVSGSEEVQTSGSDSMLPMGPVLLGSGSRFYPTGPPVPFFTMLPVYNFPTEAGNADASTSHFSGDETPDNSDSGQNFDLLEGVDQSEVPSTSNSTRRATLVDPSEHKTDILNSDFFSHWKNLQYGRFCQNPQLSTPLIYPSPVVVPPLYLQGRIPWDGPGRPLPANMFTQLMGYGPRMVPVAPLQSASNRPAGVYRYIDEVPRYRGGTGTYLPNPVRILNNPVFSLYFLTVFGLCASFVLATNL